MFFIPKILKTFTLHVSVKRRFLPEQLQNDNYIIFFVYISIFVCFYFEFLRLIFLCCLLFHFCFLFFPLKPILSKILNSKCFFRVPLMNRRENGGLGGQFFELLFFAIFGAVTTRYLPISYSLIFYHFLKIYPYIFYQC